MKKYIVLATITLSLFCQDILANTGATWKEINPAQVPSTGARTLHPDVYKVFLLNDVYLKNLLFSLPEQPEKGATISLPAPDGSMMAFRIWQTPVMAPELAAKFPGIKNFTAVAVDRPDLVARINYTYKGFNAMIYDGVNTYFIDPYSNKNDGCYICYYKRDYPVNGMHPFSCQYADAHEQKLHREEKMQIGQQQPQMAFKTNGSMRHKYRLALSCTGEYAVAIDGTTPSKPNVVSAMTTTLARVNGILERELNFSLELIANNDLLVYLDPATDPFTSTENNVINNGTQSANQANTTNVIGSLNYDIGHVFCTGDGGIADLEGVCDPGHEARAATGKANPVGDPFDVDYVIHEIGHQFGAEHTFNYNGQGCNPNARINAAYEPGSGTTIMAYAGLCSGNNIQDHSDDYYHAKSLDQITAYISTQLLCGTATPSGNTAPVVPDINAVYEIPYLTPFELEAPLATDADHDILNYCWEEYDLGDFGKSIATTRLGPIFRSFAPTASRWRIFPNLDSLQVNSNGYPGEKLPDTARVLNFRLTVRDMYNGHGSYNWSDTTVRLNVTNLSGPFKVIAPNQHSDYWKNGNSYMVTWDVANTTAAPVSCSNVDIFLSLDDGATYPITLVANTPNDGSETITVPAGSSTVSARVKVKGTGNVFFDISNQGFVINDWPDGINEISNNRKIDLYPVPAKNSVQVRLVDGGTYHAQMTNSIGQVVWNGDIEGSSSVSLAAMAPGVYHFSFISKSSGEKTVKKLVVE